MITGSPLGGPGLDDPMVIGPVVVGLVLVLVPSLWRRVRHAVTLVHEIGHAAAAVITGRRLTAIRLHSDTSGLTVSRGRPRGPGMVATAAAGYLAAPVVGLGLATAAGAGRSVAAVAAAVGLLVIVAVYVRNLFGAVVVIAALGASAALLRWADADDQRLAVSVVAWILVLGGLRTIVELGHGHGRSRGRSDVDVLARLTRVPAVVWIVLLGATGLGCAWLAARVTGVLV